MGPILKSIKPRIATLEQTFGLVTHEEHQKNFKMLLYDIGNAGYNLRYKVRDMSKLGLVQKRKRLLIIAARYVHQVSQEASTDLKQSWNSASALPRRHSW